MKKREIMNGSEKKEGVYIRILRKKKKGERGIGREKERNKHREINKDKEREREKDIK